MLSSEGSVTRLIGLIKEGDRAAAQPLWEVYFHQLVGLARARLAGSPSGTSDGEDVALSAFDSFYRRAERGQFPRLEDRDDLWQLLFVLTIRKAVNLLRHRGRASRGGGRVRSLADLDGADVDLVLAGGASPALAAEMTDECRRLLAALGDETLRSVALWKMEGYTNAEIAARLDCVEKTVERKVRAIRELWSAEAPP